MSNYFDEFYGRQQNARTVLGTPVETFQAKAIAGHVGLITGSSVNAAARWVYIFDSASADAGNIIDVIALPVGGSFVYAPMFPVRFLLGLRIHSSDTSAFHASATNDLNLSVTFI